MVMGNRMRDLRRSRQGRLNHVSIEGLEGRTLLSTYTVTNVNDTGSGSLRQAITDANKHSGADTIRFAIGSGAKTITPRSALPGIMGETVLDATTQPGFAGKPLIEVNGSSTGGSSVPGFIVYAGNSTVRGFVINRFSGNGIMLMKLGGNVIAGNYIGTNSSGTAASPNVAHGILVQSPGNRIGGTTAADRNVISGNGKSGVFLYTASSNRTTVVGNYIGTNAAGTAAVGNGLDGVQVHASHTNTIGGTTAGARNVISGNKQDGILIASNGAAGNVVQGNYVGTNAAGTAKIPNALYGVEVSQYNNTIGGTTAGARNVISGNTKSGVALYKDTCYGNKVIGNYIGTDYTGTRDLGNTGRGVDFTTGAKNNFLGGTTAAERNVISGNDTGGVGVFNGSAFNLIRGNYVGVTAAGSSPLGNGGAGVSVSNSGPNTIGGTDAGAGNVISANNQGIALAAGTGPVTIQGNKIGTDAAGTRDFGNLTDGIYVGASGALIGGSTSAACNIISANNGDGIRIYRASNVRIERNCIGVGASITTALGNTKCGVVLIGASGNTIRYNTVGNNGDKDIYVMMGANNVITSNKMV
jgi:parallel beta-helix repeat protein